MWSRRTLTRPEEDGVSRVLADIDTVPIHVVLEHRLVPDLGSCSCGAVNFYGIDQYAEHLREVTRALVRVR